MDNILNLVNKQSEIRIQNFLDNFERVNHSILFHFPLSFDIDTFIEGFVKNLGGEPHIIKPVLLQYRVKETDSSKRRLNETFIEDIRQLSQKSPVNKKYSIIIIHEFERMGDKSDILLKSIEEPNDNIMFILLTSNYSKLSQTIKSRTYQIKLVHNENFTPDTKLIDGLFPKIHPLDIYNQTDKIIEKIENYANTMFENSINPEEKIKDDEKKQLLKKYQIDILQKIIYQLENKIFQTNFDSKKQSLYNDIQIIKKNLWTNIPLKATISKLVNSVNKSF